MLRHAMPSALPRQLAARPALTLAAATTTFLAHTAPALARGGGGSAGFGGGGFSGGGGFGGGRGLGGRGHFPIFIPIGGGGFVILLFFVAVLILAASLRQQRPAGTSASAGLHVAEHLRAAQMVLSALNPFARRRRRRREQRVELAAGEAAENDPEFAPDVVHAEAEQLFRDVQKAWSEDDRDRIKRLAGPELAHEWLRRLADFDRRGWRNEVTIDGPVEVDYVGLAHRASEQDDHVVVWISARLRDVVVDQRGRRIARNESLGEVTRMSEYWTLGKRDGHWVIVSIEQEREGRHQLSEPIIATPWSDTDRLQEESLAEQAAEEKPPEGFTVADVATPELSGSARSAALDLSLVDGRFAPDLLAAEVKRAVAAWADAVDGDRGELSKLATAQAVRELLHPGDPAEQTRLVVRGPHIQDLRIVTLDAQRSPAEMTIELKVHGCRYIEDRDTTAVVSGSPHTPTAFTESWRLTLDGDDAHPWRIVSAVRDHATPGARVG
jgi:predicted lipid-binding transport protein (Tim44 family)